MGHERPRFPAVAPEETPASIAAEFTGQLQQMQDGRIRPMPPILENLNHRGVIPHDMSKFKRIAGLYMAPEMHDIWGDNPQLPDYLSFEHMPYMGLGKDTSQRKVFFGGMRIPLGGNAIDMQVAVKRFNPKNFHNAIHEIGMLSHVRQVGLPTLRVLGMLAVPRLPEAPQVYAITAYEQELDTLDNVNWAGMAPDERWSSVRPAIDTLALLHSEAVFHGDFMFKNVAFGESERSSYAIDLEYAVSLRDVLTPYGDSLEERQIVAQKVSADFASIEISVRQHITEPGADERETFEDMLEHVHTPYYAAISNLIDSPYQDVLKGAFELVLEKKRQQAYGEW